jgi:hypothetical protein
MGRSLPVYDSETHLIIFKFCFIFIHLQFKLETVPFGESTIWRQYHLAPVPFGASTNWRMYHLALQ